jgi:methyl-accepting chemotaxis protein
MSNENNATGDDSVVMCEAGDCGKGDCEKCQGSKTPEAKSMEDCMGRSMETLSQAFTASARRWEMIVYPSLFAFILLAGYGFYLIYSLTQDAHQMAKNMQDISDNMVVISERMIAVSQNTDKQAAAMQQMVVNMHGMNASMNQMRQDMSVMNYNVSRPMSKINSFMPW